MITGTLLIPSLVWFFLHSIEVQTEVRVRTSAVDFEGDIGAGSILLEDFIERHQQHALPPPDHARHSGLHIGSPGEIEFGTVKGVNSSNLYAGSRNVVVQIRQVEARIRQVEVAPHLRMHHFKLAVTCLLCCQLYLPLAPQT